MRVFVTGATGWVGSAVVPELVDAGHDVVGLARSDAGVRALTATGAQAVRGSLADLDVLRHAAASADGVVHLAFIHDFTRMATSIETDLAVLHMFCDTLAGSDRPLLFASGIPLLGGSKIATELDTSAASPRGSVEAQILPAAERGVRTAALRFAPTVHGTGDHGFVAQLTDVARQAGHSGYVGTGENRWPAVHRSDVATMTRLALEKAPAGSVIQAVGEEGIPTRTIAEAIGHSIGVPSRSVTAEHATEQAGFIGTLFGADLPASSARTQDLLGWTPVGRTLIEDIEAGAYTDTAHVG
ncbi:SDR family oxidoreductase [Gordonia desulfuricans]|uniref:SDR family oxidoreductase n=1 Tax=Gordonia desulfuricans TaxID=89051 RepID=A0A7K3LN73_9ACTN|nr:MULTISPECIES: SDR family oxidoreductase [Gordonia]EMP13724.2 3-beta hydroxysteroid dehydrogenase [Gordonia sp. NB41Y]NDK89714.1 SDR family oxidoreductase [Gordonia desulfuricans]WLP89718.1 SDR family oxidoreductase [Gordonia sp. NB41Y]